MIVSFWLIYISTQRLGLILSLRNWLLSYVTCNCNMGSCVCKEKTSSENNQNEDTVVDGGIAVPTTVQESVQTVSQGHNNSNRSHIYMGSNIATRGDLCHVDILVLETLSLIRTLVDNEQEPPAAMLTIHNKAEHEGGWLAVIRSLVKLIPLSDALGPAVIILLLDDCPLPTKSSVTKLSQMFKLSRLTAVNGRKNPQRHRNLCVVLGCLAEKLAGPISVHLLTNDVLDYLIANLNVLCHEHVILHSIITLEKFCQTSENKVTVMKRFCDKNSSLIDIFEMWCNETDFKKREVGFCARWCLDNLYIIESRPFSYENANCKNLNVMLNDNDVSEYLKLSPDGVEARCDASSFESVRCTFQIDTGIWYYEVRIITTGVMQIGWATRNSKFLNYDGYGIGDDEYSIAYDGCRQRIWHNAQSEPHQHRCWLPGDILGLLLNLNDEEIIFYLNGDQLPLNKKVFRHAKSGFFAAASFMSFQQCLFNFGQTAFKFPPSGIDFNCFNDYGELSDEERVILPRHKKLAMLRSESVKEDSCTLCFDSSATVILQPCHHIGFCMNCALQLEKCPLCRENILTRDCIT